MENQKKEQPDVAPPKVWQFQTFQTLKIDFNDRCLQTPQLGKSGKKICCSCPETKQVRDECVVTKGEENCQDVIEAHKACLREEGFRVA